MADPGASKLVQSLARFSEILSEEELQKIRAIQDAPLSTGIRLNSLKAHPATSIHALAERYGWEIKPITFCDNAWLIESASTSPGMTIEHSMGGYYLQDAASMVPVSLLDFEVQRPLILDMAASPGGKTTHLVDRTQDMGFIIANDASQRRIPALRSVIANWGAINQAVTHFPGESFGRWYPETFDSILLDAPCSMENLRPTPSHPLRETTDSERLRLQEMQIRLLISGLSALKIGGQIVYATCSLAPEENEAVIDQVLKLYPGALIVEDLASRVPFHVPGLTAYADQVFHPSLQNTLRLWPHQTGMSGFFCARLRKTGVIPVTPQAPPTRDFSRTQLEAATLNLQSAICEQIWDAYGFALDEILAGYHLQLFKRHEGIFLIPLVYLERFQTLPFELIGMQIGQWISENFHPSYEFASRFGHLFIRGKAQLDDSQLAQWIDRRDIRNPKIDLHPQGQYLLVEDKSGRNLGVGKLLSKRLRNLLPRS